VNYALNTDGSVKFDFVDAKGQVKTETYSPRTRGGGDPKGKGGQKKGDGKGKGSEPKGGSGGARPEGDRGDGRPPSDRADARPAGNAAPAATPLIINAKRSGNFVLTSPAVKDGQELPKEFNGDGKGVTANARAFLERIARNYDEGVDGIALFQTDAAVLDPSLKALLGPLFPRLADATAVSEQLAVARKNQPQMSEGERHFGLDNHSLLPQLGRAPRISIATL
jgi:hypothetical protein